MKKNWDGIRDLISVSKQSSTSITQIIHDDKSFTDNKDIAKTLNNYFVNIGPSIEAKIPKGKSPFQSYLGDQNPDSLMLNPVMPMKLLKSSPPLPLEKHLVLLASPQTYSKNFLNTFLNQYQSSSINLSKKESFPNL